MENQELDSISGGGFINSENVRPLAGEIAKWAKFLGIVGFVGTGLMVLLALVIMFTGSMGAAFAQAGLPMAGAGMIFGLIYLGVALLYFFPSRFTYQFSQRLNAALQHDDDIMLAQSLEPLKSLFKFYGILIAIALVFYALMLVFGIIGGIAGTLG